MDPDTNLPVGYWPLEKSQPIIDKTQPILLEPDLSHLTAGERKAVAKLLEVGKIFQRLYEDQRHHQALSSFAALEKIDQKGSTVASRNLLTLYRLFQGPIATTLENKREPFLPVASTTPAKNVYPPNLTQEEIESYLKLHPEKRNEILDQRTVVRRNTAQNLQRDLIALKKYPVLDTLHPGLEKKLASSSKSSHHESRANASEKNAKSELQNPKPDFYAVP
jgi:hypothetical protein